MTDEPSKDFITADAAVASALQEDARLDRALEQADRLLVASLQKQEHQRRRRNLRLGATIGGIIMIVAIGLVWSLLLPSNQKVPPAALPPAAALDTAADKANATDLSQQGWNLWQQHRFEDAADKFEQAVKIDPKLTSAWNGLGWSRLDSGRRDDAEKAFKKVIELDPKHPAALNGLGQLYFSQNKLDDAEKYLLKAAPSASAAWWTLAKIYLLQSKWDDAKTYAQKIVNSGEVSGPDLDDAKAMLDAAKNQKLPDDLRQKIAPPG